MNLQAKKLEIVQLILNTEMQDVLKKGQAADWWDDISEEEKQAIEKGLAEAERGELIPHENVMREVKAKYGLD